MRFLNLHNGVISIKDISVMVHLGVSVEERKNQQEVLWTIQYTLSSLRSIWLHLQNKISQEDLKPNVCYEELTRKIIEYSRVKEFLLIEELTLFCYVNLKKDFPQMRKLYIKLKKISPPLAYVQGGVQFEYGDKIR